MNQAKIIDFADFRKEKSKPLKKRRKKVSQKGTVYARNGKLWVDFRYFNKRVREPSGLIDTKENRIELRKQLNRIIADIDLGKFEFAKVFKHSKQKELFAELEGRGVRVDQSEVSFKDYCKKWLADMEPGWSDGKARDTWSLLRNYITPFFESRTFSDFNPYLMKKFLAHLMSRKNRFGKPLSAKTIKNVFIPLRNIYRDACDEYSWFNQRDPFARLNLPKGTKHPVKPFSYYEWDKFIMHIIPWYQPYFLFTVQTGMRPSEQTALRWDAIDDRFIHIRRSRVRGKEKDDLKTAGSNRFIPLSSYLRETLQRQKEMSKAFNSPYVFVNVDGGPVSRESLKDVWNRAFEKSGILYKQMYHLRHTFASWALGEGESPHWVAKMLGHVDTTMVYKVYGRYIPNLTNNDGSALERHFAETECKNEKSNAHFGHNFGHNDKTGVAYLRTNKLILLGICVVTPTGLEPVLPA